MREPTNITSGNSATWDESLSDYPASAWTLKYSIVSATNRYEVIASANGDDHKITIDSATTTTWIPGIYKMIAFVEKASERVTVLEKDFEVLPNHVSPVDLRSFAEKIVEAIEATILNKATKDQLSMAINGKSITRYAPEQLIVFRDRFKREAAKEKALRKAKNNGRISGRLQVRFK